MADGDLSYADVQRIFRTEKNSPTLSEIPSDFYEKTRALIAKTEGEHREYLEKVLVELHERRRNKIVLYALRYLDKSAPPPHANPRELGLFEGVVDVVAENRDAVLARTPEPSPEPQKTPPIEKLSVRIIKPIPEIVGADSIEYGPFKEDDVAELPKDSARILIERGFAEKVESL